jgi:quercetin dioxygenase-like cupin family protein
MKRRSVLNIAAVAVVGLAVLAGSAISQQGSEHKLVTPEDIKWGPGPASLPSGAQAALLYGDPAKDGLFALRVKVPKDYHIAPHTHPKPEVVTVISGTIRLGMGETADRAKAKVLPAGSFFALSPGMAHYLFADADAVVQISTNGPWGVTYVNPKDDPRQK